MKYQKSQKSLKVCLDKEMISITYVLILLTDIKTNLVQKTYKHISGFATQHPNEHFGKTVMHESDHNRNRIIFKAFFIESVE